MLNVSSSKAVSHGDRLPRCKGTAWHLPPAPPERRQAAVLHGRVVRYADSREGQPTSLFTPTRLRSVSSGQNLTLSWKPYAPPPSRGPSCLDQASGARALSEVTGAGLARLAALPDAVFRPVAAWLAASFPADSSEPSALSTWPSLIRDLDVPLCERGLLVHCLPYYGSWLWEGITEDMGLTAVPSARQVARLQAGVGGGALSVGSGPIASAATVARRSRPAHPFGGPPPCFGALHNSVRVPSRSLSGDRRHLARRRPLESRPWPGPARPSSRPRGEKPQRNNAMPG